ncbi:MAG: Asp-tRNA(Asn)/Glu-tRNA(Gln) amidotransferase subunit GatC [Elusimicrobia bacterium]|nr:Asp-tRNA(Asn)/Glu-tRNA(Gln) amidotransferase subunit GatC [Elusimicrobiota bacterium]
MAIEEEDVRKIAKLARLDLGPEEIKLFQSQLVKILDSMAELSALDTDKVPPTNSVLGAVNRLREDEPKPFGEPERLLDNAPEREGPYFKVPKVIE